MIKGVLAVIGAFIGTILGGFDGFLYALVVLVVIDYVTGVMVGVAQKKLTSSIGFKGIFKKVLIFFLVAVAYTIDTYVLGAEGVIRTTVIFFYIANEGISIIENAAKLGLPVPKKLIDVLAQLKEQGDSDGHRSAK